MHHAPSQPKTAATPDSGRRELAFSEWHALLTAQKAREDEHCRELTKLVAVSPVPEEIVTKILSLGPERQVAVLANHPGKDIARKIESLFTVLDVFEVACADLQAQLEEFHALSCRFQCLSSPNSMM